MGRKRPLIHFCRQCRNKTIHIRNGRNASGSRRVRCSRCRKGITLTRKENGYGVLIRFDALDVYERVGSFRKVARIFGVHHQTVGRWIRHVRRWLRSELL